MDLMMLKTNWQLVPFTDHDREIFQKWPDGQVRRVTAREQRNPLHHAKLFAILRSVVDNSDEFANVDALLIALKVRTGLVDIVRGFDGEMIAQARSISFAEMDQDEFSRFYDDALRLCAEHLEISEDELERNSRR